MFTNTGNTAVMLHHWTVRDADGNVGPVTRPRFRC